MLKASVTSILFIKNFLKQTKNLDVSLKSVDNPLTTVDLVCQDIILKQIRSLDNSLEIVSEESKSTISTDYSKFMSPYLYRYFKWIDEIPLTDVLLDKSDLKFIIDPLDGTRSLVNNHLPRISNLIGVLYQGKPILGLVSAPFPKAGYNMSRLIFNSPGEGIFKVNLNTTVKEMHYEKAIFTRNQPIRIITSSGNLDNIHRSRS